MYSTMLCEGPISGLFDIYTDNQSLICKDEPDADSGQWIEE